MIHPRFVRCIQIRSENSQVKTQLVLWIFFYLRWQGDNMFLSLSPGHHQVTNKTHFYELQCLASSSSTIYLWPDDGLVIEAETCCHLVTLNKINIHNTSCVLTCESLLLICKIYLVVLVSKAPPENDYRILFRKTIFTLTN